MPCCSSRACRPRRMPAPRRTTRRRAGGKASSDRASRIDTNELFVVCVNSLGSAFGSTSPLSIDPATGTPYRITFPDLAVEDIARGGYETLKSLGIAAGAHRGGPILGRHGGAWPLPPLFPGAARNLISISGTAAATPVRHRAAFHPTRGHPARSGFQGRPVHRRAAAGNRHAHRAQAGHDDLPLGRRMGRTLRAHPGHAGDAGRGSLRARIRGAELPGAACAALCARL